MGGKQELIGKMETEGWNGGTCCIPVFNIPISNIPARSKDKQLN